MRNFRWPALCECECNGALTRITGKGGEIEDRYGGAVIRIIKEKSQRKGEFTIING